MTSACPFCGSIDVSVVVITGGWTIAAECHVCWARGPVISIGFAEPAIIQDISTSDVNAAMRRWSDRL